MYKNFSHTMENLIGTKIPRTGDRDQNTEDSFSDSMLCCLLSIRLKLKEHPISFLKHPLRSVFISHSLHTLLSLLQIAFELIEHNLPSYEGPIHSLNQCTMRAIREMQRWRLSIQNLKRSSLYVRMECRIVPLFCLW